jgi:hypothetical protein
VPGAQDRWGQHAEPGTPRYEAVNADSPYATEQPERGSIADLRRRMERLPPGHPSSPYNDDMTPKPPVARLKNLELPLRGIEQSSNGASAGAAHQPPADTAPPPASTAPAASTARPASVSTPRPAFESSTTTPAVSSNGASGRNRVTSKVGGVEQLLTRDRLATAEEPVETADEPEIVAGEPDGAEPDVGGVSSWLSTPTWADTELATADGPADAASQDAPSWEAAGWDDDVPEPDAASSKRAGHEWSEPEPGADTLTHATIEPGTERANDEPSTGSDGSWEWNGRYLTPDESRIADEALGRCRIAEGRNVFGGYGHSGLTPAMRRIEAQLEHGQLLADTESYALKPADSFKQKLADLILRHPDKSAEELALEVHDGIRYAFIFDAEHYADGTLQAHSRLKGNGFDLEVRRNCWQNRDYKGINSRWRDPAHDLIFEVQFHTAASWDVSQRGHSLYESITDPATPPEERARLRSVYAEMSAAVPVPRGCTTIPAYRKEG